MRPDEVREMIDRMRRIETRLTKFLEASGFDTKTQKPQWDGTAVSIPSMACSIKDCLSAIPSGHGLDVDVRHQGRTVTTIRLQEPAL